MNITYLNQEHIRFDFSMLPIVYRTATLVLPSKHITVDIETGAIYDQPIDNQETILTAILVAKFKEHQEDRGLKKSTIACYSPVLNALAELAPDWPPTVDAIKELMRGYRAKKRSQVTLGEYWVRLNAWFKWAQEAGYLIANPMQQVTRPAPVKVKANNIPPQDFVKVIKFLKKTSDTTPSRKHSLPHERAVRDLAIIHFAYATGCRVGEVSGLRLRDLDLEDQKATIQPEMSKTSKERSVYFGRQAQRALGIWLEIRPDIGGQVFIGTKGNGWSRKPFSPSGIYHAWRGWQEAAGIGPYKFHEIRHSHVAHSLNNGVPIHHVSNQAGHKSPDITLRIYSRSDDPDRKRAYDNKNPDDDVE